MSEDFETWEDEILLEIARDESLPGAPPLAEDKVWWALNASIWDAENVGGGE